MARKTKILTCPCSYGTADLATYDVARPCVLCGGLGYVSRLSKYYKAVEAFGRSARTIDRREAALSKLTDAEKRLLTKGRR